MYLISEAVVFVDILAPPYNPKEGRDCTYYFQEPAPDSRTVSAINHVCTHISTCMLIVQLYYFHACMLILECWSFCCVQFGPAFSWKYGACILPCSWKLLYTAIFACVHYNFFNVHWLNYCWIKFLRKVNQEFIKHYSSSQHSAASKPRLEMDSGVCWRFSRS